jgi:hypothetical protein
MNNDGVSIAFELITGELERVAEDIANQGSHAFKERRYDDVKRLSETGTNLHGFIEKVNNLLEEWQAGIDVTVRRKTRIDKFRKVTHHKKGKKTRLRVRFNSGKVIEEYFAADTFGLTIKELGFSRIEALGLTQEGIPLVGTKKSSDYNQRRIDGKYICVHSSTNRKKEILETIASRLGIGLKVEIIQ